MSPTPRQPLSVRFERFDPDNSRDVAELKRQRELCGWGLEDVEKWRKLCRTRMREMFWIFYAGGTDFELPERESLNLDNSKLGPVAPDASFRPIGHVALDWEDYHGDTSLANKEEGIVSVATFYLLSSQQGKGLGNIVMKEMEALAAGPELNAKVMTLNTVDDDFAKDPEWWAKFGIQYDDKVRRNEPWYRRLGYEAYKRGVPRYPMAGVNGEVVMMESVFMRKNL